MRTLAIMRHAKSSWDDPSLDDHDRPLGARGRADAPRVATHLAARGLAPEVVLCSSARRTRETLELVEPVTAGAEQRVEEQLYGATGAALLERVRALPESVTTALVIGHNPACQDLVVALAGAGARVDQARTKLPTAAVAVLSVPTAWQALSRGEATLTELVLPKELRSEPRAGGR